MDKGSIAAFVAGLVGLLAAIVSLVLSRSAIKQAELSRRDFAAIFRRALGADAHQEFVGQYAKSIEQLGSNMAAARLGGLHALEALAIKYPDERQTIVSVLCAYLRMPFDFDPSSPRGGSETEELAVRTSAQRIITTHLRMPGTESAGEVGSVTPHDFWPDIELDLTGAVLQDWNLEFCDLRRATFAEATFLGPARLSGASFLTGVVFDGALFVESADFDGVAFGGEARFNGATFSQETGFRSASFRGDAGFQGATFNGDADFRGAKFEGYARFQGAAFVANAIFDGASFAGSARFLETSFSRHTSFVGAKVKTGDGRNDAWPPGWGISSGDQSGTAKLVQRGQALGP
ncbi:pentapeptide repeat-containing protein [Micromonospora sp. FIMYZ51]|uniref:pentapeptide repeat-containing protein n=1 Tax=Micromonospora sp. FIMYZ51 TaxID=3051832 RepID=UPI0031201739